jgi:hypothetical protein
LGPVFEHTPRHQQRYENGAKRSRNDPKNEVLIELRHPSSQGFAGAAEEFEFNGWPGSATLDFPYSQADDRTEEQQEVNAKGENDPRFSCHGELLG